MVRASYHELEAELTGVERALQALDEGTYGQCALCCHLIDVAVLELAPTATQCPDHQDRAEPEVVRPDVGSPGGD